MRKINNEFWSLIRFIAPDNKHDKSYHRETKEVQYLRALAGEFWRFLMPKSDLQGLFIGRCKLVLIRPEWVSYNTITFKNEIAFPLNNLIPLSLDKYITQIGTLRKQECEKYCEFQLIVNSFPTGTTVKQFVIQRSTGQGVFGTFSSNQSDKFLFMQSLKAHFESNGDVSCLCEVNGNTLTVRAYINDRFFLNDQACTIEVGNVTAENGNNPQLDARYISTVVIPAKDCYDLTVSTIAVGNILTLGTQSITVVVGDTAAIIKTKFLGTEVCYTINQSERVNYATAKGSYVEVNQSKPTVMAIYQSTSGGFDYYIISITGDILEGNTIQVSASGKTPISRTVIATDTVTTLTALFNPDASKYKVIQGNVPIVSIFEGSKIVANTNDLIFTLSNKTTIASKTVDRYKCYISDDISLRNTYNLMGVTYMAKQGDTALIVAKALGQTTRQFIYEVPTGTQLIAYAQKGKLYGAENIMDVRILKQPKVRKSNQYVGEVSFPTTFPTRLINCLLNRGEWQLAVYDSTDESLVCLGNFIEFDSRIEETKLVEFSGVGEYYGYEYLENGITQRMRLPIMLEHISDDTEENMTNLMEGGFDRKETNITYYQNFVTTSMTPYAVQACKLILRHKYVIIEGVHYQSRGEMPDGYPDNFVGKGQFSGKLYLQGKKSNNHSFLGSSVALGYGTVTIEGEYVGRRILFQTSTQHNTIQESARLKCAEYDVMIDNPQQEIGCIVYENDIEVNRVVIAKNARNRIHPLVRLNTDGNVRLMFVSIEHLMDVTSYIKETVKSGYTVTEYSSESKNENPPNLTGGAYTEGFDLGFES